jgi:hypothetical protein
MSDLDRPDTYQPRHQSAHVKSAAQQWQHFQFIVGCFCA